MKDFIEEFTEISARLRRDLVLVSLAQEWERESWLDPEEMEESETIRILDVYRDRTESAISNLEFEIRSLLKHLSDKARTTEGGQEQQAATDWEVIEEVN